MEDNVISFEEFLKKKREKEKKEFEKYYFKHVFESTEHLFKDDDKDKKDDK